MSNPTEADVIGMLRHLVKALSSFAKAHKVNLSFRSERNEMVIPYCPEEIASDIVGLICRLVTYLPPNQSITLSAESVHEPGNCILKTTIKNTGINLLRIGEIARGCKQPVKIQDGPHGGTIYEMQWQVNKSPALSYEEATNNSPNISRVFPDFHAEVRRHLQSHFTKTDNLIALHISRHPKDAAFIQKVKTLILVNLDKDGFQLQ